MDLLLASLNVRGLRDRGRASRVLRDLLHLKADVITLQETHFVCQADERVLADDFVVYSAYGDRTSRGVSLLVKRSLGATVNVVFAGAAGRLIVADVAVNSRKFRIVAVYAPNSPGERVSFFRELEPYLTFSERLVLVGDWNAILDPNIDKGGRGASGKERCESSLFDMMARNDLIDRYRLDHPGQEMWTWQNSGLSIKSYIDRLLVRRVDADFIACPTFHLLGHSDHKLLLARMQLGDRSRRASHWKFNVSLLERQDFRDKLEGLIQKELVGTILGNRWWVRLKYKIKRFTINYSKRLAIDKAKMKTSLEDKISRAVDGGDPLEIDLAKRDLERLNSERYQGQVVRARLERVSNEAVNVNIGRIRKWPDRHIQRIKTPDGQTLESTREICSGFREHLQRLFTREEGLSEQEFTSYLADFPRLGACEATSCEGPVTECEIIEALKQVGSNKSPGLDGLPYEMYLRLSHLFVPILEGVFNHWFDQGAIPGQVTKGLIALLRKDKEVGEKLDSYRPITLLNTELKILAKVLSNRLQLVMEDLVGPGQNFAVPGRSIQDNLHLVRTVLEGIKDDKKAALITLDQSKAFDRVDHRFLASVLQAAGFESDFCRWISILYKAPRAVVEVNGMQSKPFNITRSVRQGCPLSPLLYVLALEPLLRRLRDEGTNPALRGIRVPGGARAKTSAFADDVTIFVSRRRDIEVVLKQLERYEKITGAKINLSKSKGLRLGAWRGRESLPGPFKWTDGPVCILGVWFGPDLQLEKNWSEVQAKVEASTRIWLQRRLSLKGRAEACTTYVFPLILYRLSVLPLSENRLKALERLLFTLLWKGGKPWVRRQVCYQKPSRGGLGMPHLACHRQAERLSFLNKSVTGEHLWAPKVKEFFPNLECNPKVDASRRPKGDPMFFKECRQALRRLPESSDSSQPRKILYRDLVEGTASDPLGKRLGLPEGELLSLWNWAPGAGFLNNSEFSLTWRLIRDALPLNDFAFKAGVADCPDCPRCDSVLEETAQHAFFHCRKLQLFWSYVEEVTARLRPDQRILLDVAYVCDNMAPPLKGLKRMVFLAILAVARLVVWTTRLSELHDGEVYSEMQLVDFFRHQLKVKIRCDRRRLSCQEFNERWMKAASLVVWKGAKWEFFFPALPRGVHRTGAL